jgi:hypothetical protein
MSLFPDGREKFNFALENRPFHGGKSSPNQCLGYDLWELTGSGISGSRQRIGSGIW